MILGRLSGRTPGYHEVMPSTGPRSAYTRRQVLTTLGLAGVAGLAACNDKPNNGGTGPGQAPKPSPKAVVAITTPKDGATDVPAGTEIVYTVQGAKDGKVTVTDDSGATVDGAMDADGKGWLPKAALAYGKAYTATVTATGDDGLEAKVTSKFTTMNKPSKQVRFTTFLADGAVVGVGMPIIVRLDRPIPQDHRAEVQRRLIVTADPVQEGIWTWYSDTEMHWRPKVYWQSGTKVTVNLRVGGLPVGGGYYGRSDLTLDFSIGQALIMTVNDKASPKVMTVTRNGKLLRKIPVSLGRPSMPSSSGTMVIIEKLPHTVFDTRDDPNPANRYVTPIDFAQRLTWGGEFIHSAPWSVSQQGKVNVSHGCINMSAANAEWLFGQTQMGDPVTVEGTSRALQYGNGWTDWNKTWDEYVKLSAI
jgi:lipoprotein-anchoring transpeptidase ErfK/SrfK